MNRLPTLYVTDLDGTLLDASSRVSAESARIIRGLVEEGAQITVATARTPATVVPLLRDCGLRLPAIVMTGAALWDFRYYRYAYGTRYIPHDMCLLIKKAAREAKVNLLVYTLPAKSNCLVVYSTGLRLTEPMKDFIAERSDLELKTFMLNSIMGTFIQPDNAILYFGMDTPDNIDALVFSLRYYGVKNFSVYTDPRIPGVKLIEIFADGVSKASVVKGMGWRRRIVVFGDNLNDLPMMEVADVAVAVENAMPEVKEAADIVIGPNTADSVARFIYDDFHSPGNG